MSKNIARRKNAEKFLSKEVSLKDFLLDLNVKAAGFTDKELYHYVLDHVVRISDSTIGFFHLVSDDQKNIILTTWNNETLKTCKASYETHYPIESAGNWVDCVRFRRVVVYNDYAGSPNQKGYPDGHVPIKRFMSVPVIEGDKVRIIFGVGNKAEVYDDHDVLLIQLLANDLQRIIGLRHAQEALKHREAYFRSLIEKSSDMITILDADGIIRYESASVKRILGYEPSELIGRSVFDFAYPDDLNEIRATFGRAITKKGNPLPGIQRYLHKDGSWRYLESVDQNFLDDKEIKGLVVNSHDVTGRKQVENALRESEARLNTLVHTIPDLIWMMDFSGQFTYANEAVERTHGWTVGEWLKLNTRDVVSPQQFAKNAAVIEEELAKAADPQYDRNAIFSYESEEIRKDGTTFLAEINATSLWSEDGKPIGIIGITRDISDRKKAETALKESEEKFAESFLKSPIPLAITAMEDGRYVDVNEAFAKVMGRQREELMDSNSIDTGYITAEQRAIFLDEYRRKGFVENLELQICVKGGDLRDGLFNSSKVTIGNENYFLTQVTDITERKRMEEKLQHTLESLKKAVGTTIQVLVSALEAKDPYTSGHQSRSADVACAIAREMGLSEEIIEGISMAGTIHDIGKLSIPGEILTKPSKLTDLEFSLVKEHSRSGYEMLKEVESPWALAEIVHQHHERMNGTGYPRQLKGDEIRLEARILAVADVVEAMASHRPYRPSLGIKAAIEEIEKNRGVLYDADVVDACLRLFREKGYQLKQEIEKTIP
ncbi:MAG: PAS domain S-box protein [Smithella sp.]|jgi:PAS domain S-box-containing protein